MDQNLLPQVTEKMTEGEKPTTHAIIWEPQRIPALGVGLAVTFQSRERGDYWRVTVIDSVSVLGNNARALVGQGVSVWANAAIQLGGGGTVKIPASESSITVLNIGDTPLDIVVIMVGGFCDEYITGETIT